MRWGKGKTDLVRIVPFGEESEMMLGKGTHGTDGVLELFYFQI